MIRGSAPAKCLAGFDTSLDEYTSGEAAKAYLQGRLPAVVMMMMIVSVTTVMMIAAAISAAGAWIHGGSWSSH